jgi:hypothetical protein
MWTVRRILRTKTAKTLFGLGVLGGAGWLLLPVLIERRLLDELEAAGIVVAGLNVTSAGLFEARIADIRLGLDGEISAGEVIASYNLTEILGSPLEHIVVRDLHVQGRLDSDGLLFGRLGPANDSGGPLLSSSFIQTMPPVEIESGRIDLATPIGPVILPVHGLLAPVSDGSLAGTLDVQVQSERGAIDGTLALVAQERRINADLTINTGSITSAAGNTRRSHRHSICRQRVSLPLSSKAQNSLSIWMTRNGVGSWQWLRMGEFPNLRLRSSLLIPTANRA